MTAPQSAIVKPYGSWKSPITADLIVADSIRLGELGLDQGQVYWTEGRPTEKGRNVLVAGTTGQALTPPPFNVRTRVHEYGGGSFRVVAGTVYFVNFADQRLYRLGAGETDPQPLTPESESALRYADMIGDPWRQRLIAVREDHRAGGHEPVNALVSLGVDPSNLDEGTLLASGHDFYASPCLSPDGSRLAWLTWDHPQMPWDGTILWVAEIQPDGSLGEPLQVAGGSQESIFQPQWSPDGILYFVSDRSNWWNLYRWTGSSIEAVCPRAAEFGQPQWVFGMSTYGFVNADEILCVYSEAEGTQLAHLAVKTGSLRSIEIPFTSIGSLRVDEERALFVGGSPTQPAAIVLMDLATETWAVLRKANELEIDPGYLSIPEAIEFPTENGLTAHGYFYAPTNADFQAPEGETPPLLVKSHGGPTASTSASFNLGIQYWTSRGIAVLDVNYGGSTGYGREYRQRLQGNWGIVDVDDCVNGARYLTEQGKADPERLCIDGGSAGGYTTLAALAFRDVFKAGASYYGVSDLAALVRDTHKFESRYLDGLVGSYPEQEAIYQARSPIFHTEGLTCPVIFFQGLEDKIVPPNQAEMMVEALKAKGLPVAYLPFEGEQHGFRQSATIKRTLEAELYFYGQVFGFELVDPIEPVQIDNL